MAWARFIVRGRVQGVCFRAGTRDAALRLQLSGHARNLADGSVEVLACGDESVLAELERWLHVGPPAARVESVRRAPVDAGVDVDLVPAPGFRVR